MLILVSPVVRAGGVVVVRTLLSFFAPDTTADWPSISAVIC